MSKIKSHQSLISPQALNPAMGDYPTLGRRQFLLHSSVLAAAACVLALPKSLRAADMLLGERLGSELILLRNLIGFNGERRDPLTGLYHLGQGYRAYNTSLMRFHTADSMSPFGQGGSNAYAYCLGNPGNMIDPTGHASTGTLVAIFTALVGLVLSVVTFGTAVVGIIASIGTAAGVQLGAVLSATGTLMGLAAGATKIASASLDDKSPHKAGLNVASLVLGVGSMGFGATGSLTTAAVAHAGRVATSAATAATTLETALAKVQASLRSSPTKITVPTVNSLSRVQNSTNTIAHTSNSDSPSTQKFTDMPGSVGFNPGNGSNRDNLSAGRMGNAWNLLA